MKKSSKITPSRGNKIIPYLSAEIAFLSFIDGFKEFVAKFPTKVYLRDGPRDPVSGLRPREILGLVIAANVAMSESGDSWAPGWFVDSDGKPLPEDIAHDGLIRCVSGTGKGKFMHFEQVMATEVAKDAVPEDIEGAIIREANRKAAKGTDYVGLMALIVFVDYTGELGDLRKLASDINSNEYEAIYLIGLASKTFKDFVCVVLKNPSDTLGPISVKFNRADGIAEVTRMH